MGARKKHAPKRGSLAFTPRKRAKSLNPDIKTWPTLDVDEPKLLGFAGYKAGMTHVYYLDEYKYSPYKGQEIFSAATIIEVPPLYILGVVGYKIDFDNNRLISYKTIIAPDFPEFIKRRIKTLKITNFDKSLREFEDSLDKIKVIRTLVSTQPIKAGIHKKKPEIFEIQLGGKVDIREKFNYALNLLGNEIDVTDVFSPGDIVDVIAVTRGKGFQGPVKRWGIKLLSHKSRKARRKPGALGPWKPSATRYTVPLAGQLGFHRRTIYHLKILDIRDSSEFDHPLSFKGYGQLKSKLLLVKGSVPGPSKRLIKMRFTVRPVREEMKTPVRLTYIKI